jgi:hypothetical protein
LWASSQWWLWLFLLFGWFGVLYLSTMSGTNVRSAMETGWLGAMMTPDQGYKKQRFDSIVWAADNGCFTNPDRSLWQYLTFLTGFSEQARNNCLFATALDVVGDADATRRRSIPCLTPIRNLGYKVAYVAQDGSETDSKLIPWNQIDALFLGGTTDWKLGVGAKALAVEARRKNKWVHMGRVNSRRRYLYASTFCDSADGTYIAFGPDQNLPKVISWVQEETTTQRLPLEYGIA